MGVEYERWLIARGNVFAPSAESIIKFVAKLRAEGFIVDPTPANLAKLTLSGLREERAKLTGGYAVKTVPNQYGKDVRAKISAATEAQPSELTKDWLEDPSREELRLVWPVAGESPPVKYPLSLVPEAPTWSLEIHRAPDYVYPISDGIDALDTTCRCGEDLEFEWDLDDLVPAFGAANGIFAECEDCSRTFDPAKRTATVRDPFDGPERELAGGAAYRFALKVTCGESFVRDARLAFAPELVALVEKEFGREFYQVGSVS